MRGADKLFCSLVIRLLIYIYWELTTKLPGQKPEDISIIKEAQDWLKGE